MRKQGYLSMYGLAFILILLFSLGTGVMAATPWDGTADTSWYNVTDKVFEIGRPEELAGLAKIVNGSADGIAADTFAGKTVKLTADLDLGGVYEEGAWNSETSQKWTTIGTYTNPVKSSLFAGSFDGNGKTIKNLYIKSSTTYQGLFAGIDKSGKVYNLNIKDSFISSTANNTSALVSINRGAILNCYTGANVSGTQYVGGLVAVNQGYIINCVNTGTITGSKTYIGGITANNTKAIKNVYNTGMIKAASTSSYVGGLAANSGGTVSNGYNTGIIETTATNKVGPLFGQGSGDNVYYLVEQATGDAAAKTAAQLQGLAPVLGESFAADSNVINNGFPVMSWQNGAYSPDETFGLDLGAADIVLTQNTVTVTLNKLLEYSILSPADFVLYAQEGENIYPIEATSVSQSVSNDLTVATITFPKAPAGKTVTIFVSYGNGTKKSAAITTEHSDNWLDYAAFGFAGGNGSVNDPYRIKTPEQLAFLASQVNGKNSFDGKFIALAADIDLIAYYEAGGKQERRAWFPIGPSYTLKFSGNFDGRGHTVSGLYIDKETTDIDLGLFGLTSKARIINVVLAEPTLTVASNRYNNIGGLVGYAWNTSVINCAVEGGMVTGESSGVGGLVGRYIANNEVPFTELSSSYSTAAVKGGSTVGGLMGTVAANVTAVGGNGTIYIHDCYSGGNVEADTLAGGLIGEIRRSAFVEIKNCYASGSIAARSVAAPRIGGLVGNVVVTETGNESVAGFRLTNSVAMNPSISYQSAESADNISRILGNGAEAVASGLAQLSNNLALAAMVIQGETLAGTDANDRNGLDIARDDSALQSSWEDLDFDFSAAGSWAWTPDGMLPGLNGNLATYNIKILMQPRDTKAYKNKDAKFFVKSSQGAGIHRYQWQVQNGDAWEDIGGETKSYLLIKGSAALDGSQYRCVVSDDGGQQVLSDAAKLIFINETYTAAIAGENLLSYYQRLNGISTTKVPIAIRSFSPDTAGYAFDLAFYDQYYPATNSSYSEDGLSAWFMLDGIAKGENPNRMVKKGKTAPSETVDMVQSILGRQAGNGALINTDNGYDQDTVIDNALYYLVLEIYFNNSSTWGNEEEGTKYGRDGAYNYLFDQLEKHQESGGKYFYDIEDRSGINDHLKYQCFYAMLMARLAGDRVYGIMAKNAMYDVMTTLKYHFDEGILGDTEITARYLSALMAAANATNNSAKKAAYLSQADKVFQLLTTAQAADGSYFATLRHDVPENSGDGAATAAVMMALADYTNGRSILAALNYSVSDAERVDVDLAALSLPDTVTGSISLPVKGLYGTVFSWESSQPGVIDKNGKVIRQEADASVTLTVTAAFGQATDSKTFKILVKAAQTAESDEIDKALAALKIPIETTADLALPTEGQSGTQIAWSSNNSAVIADNGKVTRPASGDDVTVELTATVSKNGMEKEKVFPVLVYAQTQDSLKEGYYAARSHYLNHRDISGSYWDTFAAYATLGDYIQDPANGYSLFDVSKHKAGKEWQGTDYGAVLLHILCIGENPYNYNGTNFVEKAVAYGTQGPYANPIWSSMGLEAAGAKGYTSNVAYAIGQTKPAAMTYGIDIAGWSLALLSRHLGEPGVDESIADFAQLMLENRGEGGVFDYHSMGSTLLSSGCVVTGFSALLAAGQTYYDVEQDPWPVDGISIINTLYREGIVNSSEGSYGTQILIELADLYNVKYKGGNVAWLACGVSKDKLDAQIAKAQAILEDKDLYTEDSIGALESALATVNGISADRLKAKIADYGEEYFTLYDAVRFAQTLDGAGEDEAAAAAVTEQVNALPAAGAVQLTDKEAVAAARSAYDILTVRQKALVPESILAKLTAVEAALESLADIEAVRAQIDALPVSNAIQLTDKEAIAAARSAYDALSDNQKASIPAEVLAKLTAAEEALKKLEAPKPPVDIGDMTDVAPSAWYYEDVAYVLSQGIMNGMTPTTFGPALHMTRAQFITILGRYAGVEDSSAAFPSMTIFGDVKSSGYYAAHVAWGISQGITNGTSDRTFNPDAQISRQDMAVMMARYARAMGIALPDGNSGERFADHDKIATYAKDAVYQMKAADVLRGKEDSRFDPIGFALRSEAAAIMHRFMDYAVNGPRPQPRPLPEGDTVTVSVEKFTLGLGYIVEPLLVEIEEGDTAAAVLTDVLAENGIEYDAEMTDKGFYLAAIKDSDKRAALIPQYILDRLPDGPGGRGDADWLGEFDYNRESGWIYWVNNEAPNISAGDREVADGDVIRWQFTIVGLGKDLGKGVESDPAYINTANKDALTTAIAEINWINDESVKTSAAYTNALTVLNNMESSQEEVDAALAALQ